METDFLRLILFLVGIVVVLAVYFWERHKRINAQLHAIRNAEQSIDEIREDIESDKWVVMDEYQDDAESEAEIPDASDAVTPKFDEVAADENEMSHELDQLSELVAEESTLRMDQTEQMPLFSNDEFEEYSLESNLESKVFVINLVSQQTGFTGAKILAAAMEVGLELGEMNIFYRYSETPGRKKVPLFNMANMVEPGTFPMDKMEEFVTPGLSLFLQISGGQSGLALYDEMLMAAEKLAASLEGQLQDETHCALTRQAIEFQREEIIEYQRRQMLKK